jgi:serine/threonine protein kinase
MTNPRDAKNNYDAQNQGEGNGNIALDQTVNASPRLSRTNDSNNFVAGQILAGKYKMLSVLGSGGMGTVYHVQQIFLNIEMALKVLDFKQAENASNLNRFAAEAKAAYALNHHTLVKVFDFGVLEQGQPYFAMEYIAGTTLAHYLKKSGPLPLSMVAPIFSQIAEGLDYAHEHSVVHRDIKPGNIMLVDGTEYGAPGSVRIVDFGIAKTVTHVGIGEIQALTQTGEIFGSPLYMSPEQCSGGAIDNRTDVYSLGCTLFEALTGTPPYVGVNPLRTMMLHTTGDFPSLTEASMGREFPRGLNELVHKMLAKVPEDRYQQLWTMSKELNDIIANKSASAGKNDHDKKRPNLFTAFNPKDVRLLYAAAITLIVIGCLAGQQFLNRADRGEKQPEAKRPQDNDLLPMDETALENGYLQRLKESEKAFADAGPVVSKIVGEGPNKKRQIVFPAFPIGRIYTIQNRLISKRFHIAVGTQYLPPDGDLLLNTGGDYKEAFYSPTIFETIGPNLFTRLVLARPAYRLEFKSPPEESEITNKAASILAIASRWKALKEIYLDGIILNADSLSALAHTQNLRVLEIHKCMEVGTKSSQWDFLNKLDTISLEQSTMPNMLPSIRNSRALKTLLLFKTKVQAKDLDGLPTCSQLKFLKIEEVEFNENIIPKIAKIKSLETIDLGRSRVTSQQMRALLQACPKLVAVIVSRDSKFDFQDSRIHFKD